MRRKVKILLASMTVLLGPLCLKAQLFFNSSNTGVFVEAGAILYIEGGVELSDGGVGDAWFDNEGEIQVGANLFPIAGIADWVNNNLSNDGMIDDRNGIVEFVSGSQDITGISLSRFNSLSFTSTSGEFNMFVDVIADKVLDLGFNNELNLNSSTLTLLNSDTAAINSSLGGYIISETNPLSEADYGTVVWDISGGSGTYQIPFNSGVGSIPLQFSLLSAGLSAVSFSTYSTAIDNTDYPSVGTALSDPVTDMYSSVLAGDNSGNSIDRFWIIDLGLNLSIDVSFNYNLSDVSAGVLGSETLLFAQNWIAGEWQPGIGTSSGPAIPKVNAMISTSGAWTLARTDFPLPITCLGFTGQYKEGLVELEWEATNEEFVQGYFIDRSLDLVNWQELDFISVGENEVINVYLWREFVVNSIENGYYYRLRELDFNANEEFACDLIYVSLNSHISIAPKSLLFPNPSNGIITLTLHSDKEELAVIDIFNSIGKHLDQRETLLSAGVNSIEFDLSNFLAGYYVIQVKTDKMLVIKKVQLIGC